MRREVYPENRTRLTAAQLLKKYTDDNLPFFFSRPIEDVNQLADRPIHFARVYGKLRWRKAERTSKQPGALDTRLYCMPPLAASWILPMCYSSTEPDVTARNEFRQTPIDLARFMSKDRVIETLESAKRARS